MKYELTAIEVAGIEWYKNINGVTTGIVDKDFIRITHRNGKIRIKKSTIHKYANRFQKRLDKSDKQIKKTMYSGKKIFADVKSKNTIAHEKQLAFAKTDEGKMKIVVMTESQKAEFQAKYFSK